MQVGSKAKKLVERRPAETATPVVWAAFTSLLIAFDVDPARATAVSGFIAAVTPMLVTWWKSRRVT